MLKGRLVQQVQWAHKECKEYKGFKAQQVHKECKVLKEYKEFKVRRVQQEIREQLGRQGKALQAQQE